MEQILVAQHDRPRIAERAQTWLESPWWDGFWILSGLWLLAVILVGQAIGQEGLIKSKLDWYAPLLLQSGHLLAPVILGWTNPGLRRFMLERKGKFVVAPVLIIIVCVLLGLLGDLSQWTLVPESIQKHVNPRFFLFYLFLVWNTWHFASQHFGVLAIYRRLVNRWHPADYMIDRLVDRWFSILMSCVLLPLAWYAQHARQRLGPLLRYLPSLSEPELLMRGVIVVSMIATLMIICRELRKSPMSPPRILYMLSIGIQPAFVAVSHRAFHLAVVAISHWMVELALVSRLLHQQLSQPPQRIGRPSSLNTFAMVIALLIILSTFCWPFLIQPGLDSRTGPRFRGWSLGPLSVPLGALSGLLFAIQFIHFFYDRYVYAFRIPDVKRAISPLLFPVNTVEERPAPCVKQVREC